MLLYAPKFKNNGSTVGKSGALDDDDNDKASKMVLICPKRCGGIVT